MTAEFQTACFVEDRESSGLESPRKSGRLVMVKEGACVRIENRERVN